MGPELGEITRLLAQWNNGEAAALETLVPLVYPHLREVAAAYVRRERAPGVMQATSLVHELYLRLLAQEKGRMERSRPLLHLFLKDHAYDSDRSCACESGAAARCSGGTYPSER